VGCRAGLAALEKRKFSCPCQEPNDVSSQVQPLAQSLYWLSYPGPQLETVHRKMCVPFHSTTRNCSNNECCNTKCSVNLKNRTMFMQSCSHKRSPPISILSQFNPVDFRTNLPWEGSTLSYRSLVQVLTNECNLPQSHYATPASLHVCSSPFINPCVTPWYSLYTNEGPLLPNLM